MNNVSHLNLCLHLREIYRKSFFREILLSLGNNCVVSMYLLNRIGRRKKNVLV
jgi:hypothetical protein